MEPVAEDCVSLPVDDIGDCRVRNAPVIRDDTLTEEGSLTERARQRCNAEYARQFGVNPPDSPPQGAMKLNDERNESPR